MEAPKSGSWHPGNRDSPAGLDPTRGPQHPQVGCGRVEAPVARRPLTDPDGRISRIKCGRTHSMQYCRTYGSVRGVEGNLRPYRDRCSSSRAISRRNDPGTSTEASSMRSGTRWAMRAILRYHRTVLGEQPTDLVGLRRTNLDKTLPHPVQRKNRLLLAATSTGRPRSFFRSNCTWWATSITNSLATAAPGRSSGTSSRKFPRSGPRSATSSQ